MIRITCLILVGCAMVLAGEEMRLPVTLRPSTYDIRLMPHFEENNFIIDGSIDILVDCNADTNVIILNSVDITVDQSSIKISEIGSEDVLTPTTIVYHGQMFTIGLEDEKMFTSGKQYKISMNFIAQLNDDLSGFYRSSYKEDGVTKYLAVTQFEATDARRAFPCFDEPDFKASFTITLGRHKSMTSASNMPIKQTIPIEDKPDYFWDCYEPSLKMSTYLVAMLVSEFVSIPSKKLDDNVEFRIWARPNFKDQTEYAGEIGPQVLAFYEDYFDIKFPLPKQDMAAIPDFAAGAMENWGLVTYREADLLIDPKKSPAEAKQRVATVIAHELAHQWFGDLVTMDWWDSVWLNEGFALYMQHIGTNAIFPEYEMNEQFITDVVHDAMAFDGLTISRPMNINVTTPDEIKQLFDAIAYQKGASVIKMCLNFLGEDTFKRGLTRYLNSKAYGNAVQDDLWNALNEQADIDSVILDATVTEIMETWTNQQGYPLIKVTREYGNGGATVHQERFLMDPETSLDSSDETDYKWWVPLTFKSLNTTQKHAWMSVKDTSKNIVSVAAADDQWVIFNVDQVGYYRVTYDEINYDLILGQLLDNHQEISTKNRAQLMDDSLNFARAGVISYERALNMTLYLKSERDYLPWRAAVTALAYLDTILYNSPAYGDWKNYLETVIIPLYEVVQFNENADDSHLTIFTRTIAAQWACKLGQQNCVQNAKTYYAAWMKNDDSMSPNQKGLIACTAIENGGKEEWDFAYQTFLSSTVAAEKKEMLSAMSCTRQPGILYHMLELMIEPTSGIRVQDATELFQNIASTPLGNRIAFDFLTDRWDEMEKYFMGASGFGGGILPTFFRAVCNRLNTEEQLEQLTKLREDHIAVLESAEIVQQGIEIVQSNLKWISVHYDSVDTWLSGIPIAPTSAPTSAPTQSPSSANLKQQSLSFIIGMTLNLLIIQHLFQ